MDKDVPRINWTEEKYEHLLAIEERKKKDLLFRLDVALVKKKQLKRQVEKLTFIARTSIATEKLKSICEPIDYGYKYDGPTGARPAPVIWHKSYGVDAYGSRYAPDKTQRAEDEEPSPPHVITAGIVHPRERRSATRDAMSFWETAGGENTFPRTKLPSRRVDAEEMQKNKEDGTALHALMEKALGLEDLPELVEEPNTHNLAASAILLTPPQ